MRGLKSLAAGCALVSAIVMAWLAPASAAEEETRIELNVEDSEGAPVARARVEFLAEDGDVTAIYERMGRSWIRAEGSTESEGWGREVTHVRIRAFGCARTNDVAVEKETRGSLFGGFAPHPSPLTHVYVIRGAFRCPAPGTSAEKGIELAQLLREIRAGEPVDDAAAGELIRIGPGALAGMPDIIATLEASDRLALRVELIRALGAIGPAAGRAVGPLGKVLRDPDPRLHRIAATALEAIGPQAPGLVEALGNAARLDSDRQTQDHIARILGRMGAAARAAEPDLVAILENESEEDAVRRAAFSALGHLKTSTARAAQDRYAETHPILY
jgi:hypothetical protein